jgi:hypothetical protein
MNLGHPSTELTMTKYVIGLAVGTALVVATVVVAQLPNPAQAAAQKDVLDVAKAIEDGKGNKAIQAKVKAIKGKGTDLADLMWVYKNRQKAGLGFGAKPADDSGIEKKILELQRTARGPAAAALKRDSEDLIKMAYVTLAMAEITRPYFNKPANGKGRMAWNKWLDDQEKASRDLIAAVKAENPKAVAQAAKNLLNSCTECHAVFRN